jgi:hypothetical protein
MVIALLLCGVFGGISGAGLALYWSMGWVMILGGYVLGGMIGCALAVSISLSRMDDAQTRPKPASKPTPQFTA